MRFDDRLATVLGHEAGSEAERQALWRQLTDLLAQHAGDAPTPARADAFARLRALRPSMPEPVRRAAAAALAWQSLPSDLILFLAEDSAAVAAPVLGTALAPDREWADLIPRLSPVARSLLRHRRDLGPAARHALEAFGPSDLIIPAPAAAALTEAPAAPAAPEPPAAPVETFRFEAGPDGVIRWCDLDARGAVIGLSLAAADQTRAHGVDGQAAGAFRRRADMRDARLTVAGEGAIGGEWRISAVPIFDPASGRFQGYRGHARRPLIGETAAAGLFGTALPGESLRQLAHEIRTPLNAIIGFAEMIDRQLLGPVNARYRERAGDILGEARTLLETVDDLDTAARLEGRALRLAPARLDLAALIAPLSGALERQAAARGARFALELTAGLPPVKADPVSAERMVARLAGAVLGLAAAGEAVTARLDAAGPALLRLTLDRPARLAGLTDRALLDPGLGADEDWADAPVLGLGFTLRLVRGLAEAAGGRLAIEPDRFVLTLPAAAPERHAAG